VLGNPVMLIDPDGREAKQSNGGEKEMNLTPQSMQKGKNQEFWGGGADDGGGGKNRKIDQRRKERADKLFQQKIVNQLTTMVNNFATNGQVQAQANVLARKYQKRWWLHYMTYGFNANKNTSKSSATGWNPRHEIIIRAFSQTTFNMPVLNFNRTTDGNQTIGNIGFNAPAGSVVTVQFSPMGVANGLTVGAAGDQPAVSTNGPIVDNTNTANNFIFQGVGTTNVAGPIQYNVTNSNPIRTLDNWQLRVSVTTPPVLNPRLEVRN
jgi:hypothetical protein